MSGHPLSRPVVPALSVRCLRSPAGPHGAKAQALAAAGGLAARAAEPKTYPLGPDGNLTLKKTEISEGPWAVLLPHRGKALFTDSGPRLIQSGVLREPLWKHTPATHANASASGQLLFLSPCLPVCSVTTS